MAMNAFAGFFGLIGGTVVLITAWNRLMPTQPTPGRPCVDIDGNQWLIFGNGFPSGNGDAGDGGGGGCGGGGGGGCGGGH
jgi:hypothetical protein